MPLRQRDAQELLGVDVELGPESAADGRGDDAHLLLGDAERERDHDLQDVRDLCGGVEDHVAAERLRHGRACPRFHRHRDQALLDVALLHHVGGAALVDGGRHGVLADLQVPRVALVRAERFVDHDPIGQRIFEIDHGGERLVLDLDGVEGVVGDRIGCRQHARHSVADVARLRHCERIVGRVLHVGRDRPRAWHRAGPGRFEIGAAVDGHDARHRRRRTHVDTEDPCVGVRAAEHRQVQRAGEDEVVGVLRLAGEQRRIFAAQHPGADDTLCAFLGDGHWRHPVGRSQHRLDDVVVPRAAAEVALEPHPDLVFGGMRVLVEQPDRGHHHARGAVAALEPVVLHERLLHRVHLAVLGESLDGEDLLSVCLDGKHGAALHRFAVDVNGAGAAGGRVATDVRAGEADRIAYVVDEQASAARLRSCARRH